LLTDLKFEKSISVVLMHQCVSGRLRDSWLVDTAPCRILFISAA